MADELVNRLMQLYGDADPLGLGNGGWYRNPATENYRADPYNELGTQVSTGDIQSRVPQTNALSGLVRALAGHVPENTEHAFSLANMVRGGMGSLANWSQGSPGAADMLSPPGMGLLRGAASRAPESHWLHGQTQPLSTERELRPVIEKLSKPGVNGETFYDMHLPDFGHVGRLKVHPDGTVGNVWIDPAFRRQGLASHLYDYAERDLGVPQLGKGSFQTPEGLALRRYYEAQ